MVVLLFEYDRTQEAEHWFNYLKTTFTNGVLSDETNMTVEAYAYKQIQAEVLELDPNKATAFIEGLTTQEYLCLIADNPDDDDRAERFRRMAQFVWQSYHDHLPKGAAANRERIALRPLEQLQADELDDLESRLSPVAVAILRGKLHLPPRAPAAPPANPPSPAVGGPA
jgi:hypothetical protein